MASTNTHFMSFLSITSRDKKREQKFRGFPVFRILEVSFALHTVMEKIEKFIIDHKKIEIQPRSFSTKQKRFETNDMNQDFMDFLKK